MTSSTDTPAEIVRADRWAIAPSLDSLGDGMFRRVRTQLGITAFGINVKVMQPDSSSKLHLHTEQQEVIFVHAGSIRVTFGEGVSHDLHAGGFAVVDPGEPHVVRVLGDEPAVLVMMGGKDGVVEGDAVFPDDA